MKVDKTVFVGPHVWYLTIVKFKTELACFWSHHVRTGLSDENAKRVFKKEHFKEVEELKLQYLQKQN